MLTHSSTDCKHCNATFKSKRLLDDHIVNKHPDAASCYNLITCEHCDTTYKTKKLLHDHILKKHPDFIHQCPNCEYKTAQKIDLDRHLLKHPEVASLHNLISCKHCNTSYKSQQSLRNHIIRTHPDLMASVTGKVHECQQCTYKTSMRHMFHEHIRKKHPNSVHPVACNVYECSNCDYKTTKKDNIDRHTLKHNGGSQSLISCQYCNATYKGNQSLDYHIVKKHPDFIRSVNREIYKCSICPYTNLRKYMLRNIC
nr:unnamed protein product [Callosobruchus analis]